MLEKSKKQVLLDFYRGEVTFGYLVCTALGAEDLADQNGDGICVLFDDRDLGDYDSDSDDSSVDSMLLVKRHRKSSKPKISRVPKTEKGQARRSSKIRTRKRGKSRPPPPSIMGLSDDEDSTLSKQEAPKQEESATMTLASRGNKSKKMMRVQSIGWADSVGALLKRREV